MQVRTAAVTTTQDGLVRDVFEVRGAAHAPWGAGSCLRSRQAASPPPYQPVVPRGESGSSSLVRGARCPVECTPAALLLLASTWGAQVCVDDEGLQPADVQNMVHEALFQQYPAAADTHKRVRC